MIERNIVEVINQILEIVPSSECILIKELSDLQESAKLYLDDFGGVSYLMSPQQIRGGFILIDKVYNLNSLNDQQQKVIDIWLNQQHFS